MDTSLPSEHRHLGPGGQIAPAAATLRSRQRRIASFAVEALSARWRPLVVLATVVASVAHIPVIGPHLDEAPYMGVLFIVLTVVCMALAVAALVRDSKAVYMMVIVTCGLAVIGYAATRLVAFPMLSDDVGNWLEPLGVVSIVSESIAVAAAIAALAGGHRNVRNAVGHHGTSS
jgi:hypothetical protein